MNTQYCGHHAEWELDLRSLDNEAMKERSCQRVLICEDDEVSRVMLRTIFEKQGMEIVGEATTGLDAIRLYDEKHPDLVLLDIHMPKGGGITILRYMRELDKENGHEPYIVVFTGEDSKHVVHTAQKLGANDYLLKSSVTKPDFYQRLINSVDSKVFALEELQKKNQNEHEEPFVVEHLDESILQFLQNDSSEDSTPKSEGNRMVRSEKNRFRNRR